MRNTRLAYALIGASLLAGAIVATAACGDDDAEHPEHADAWGGSKLEVEATEFLFEPTILRVKADQRYLLHLVNRGNLLHDWAIDAIPAKEVRVRESEEHGHEETLAGGTAPGLHLAADKGKEAEISFIPMRRGEYEFYCTVPGHRSTGMEGTLIVE